MYAKIVHTCCVVSLCGVLFLGGCKKKSPSPAPPPDANAVKKELGEALDVTGDYLMGQKDVLVQKAKDSYSKLDTETKQLVSDLNASGKEAWNKTSTELQEKIQAANEKLKQLQQATKEDIKKSKDAFDKSLQDAKDAWQKAKDQFDKDQAEPSEDQPTE